MGGKRAVGWAVGWRLAFGGWLAVGRLACGLSVGRGLAQSPPRRSQNPVWEPWELLWELFGLLGELSGLSRGVPGYPSHPKHRFQLNLEGSGASKLSQNAPTVRVVIDLGAQMAPKGILNGA